MTIWDLKNMQGGPRFHPPGSHPATYRMRAHLRLLEKHHLGDHESADYIRNQIAAFEEGESEAKLRMTQLLDRKAA